MAASPVPEPGTAILPLLLTGLAAFLGPLLVLARLRRPRIISETNGLAVLVGTGRPFLDAQRAVAEPPAPATNSRM